MKYDKRAVPRSEQHRAKYGENDRQEMMVDAVRRQGDYIRSLTDKQREASIRQTIQATGLRLGPRRHLFNATSRRNHPLLNGFYMKQRLSHERPEGTR